MAKIKKTTPIPSRMRVGLYVRVSTLEQANEGHSISVQQEKLATYCIARGWDVYFTYTDPGFSGSNMERPALKRMFSDIKAGHLDMVLVYKLDRLSRSQRDTLYMIEDVFLANNVDFVSMTENFDTSSPLGRAMIGILSVFAQLEREQIKERMAMGNMARAASGLWRGGSGAPIGYDYIDGRLVINEYEAAQIRLIFDLFLKGHTFNAIQTKLKTSGYTNHYGTWNNSHTVTKILQNSTYIGKLRYAGKEYEGVHEPIISQEIWNAAQLRLKEVLRNLTDHQKTPFIATKLLTGFTWCGECGARYFFRCCNHKNVAGISIKYDYYRCYTKEGHKKMRTAAKCSSHSWHVHKLDNLIINEIKKLAFNPEEIKILINKSREAMPEDTHSVAIKKRLEEIEKQTNKIMDLYTLGNIPLEVISTRAEALAQEREKLLLELESLQIPEATLSAEEAIAIVANTEEVFANGTMEEKRAFLSSLVNKIVVYPNDDIDIHWKFL